MPRELTHWRVLQMCLQSNSEPSSLIEAARQWPAHAQLGAVLHDAPYFHRFGGSAFETIAERLHGTGGEDTLAPLAALALDIQKHRQEEAQQLRAVLAGMLSHAACDIIFHPLVYYFTGNYYDPDPKARDLARTEHRSFEVYLDYFVAQDFKPENELVSEILRKTAASQDLICAWLAQELYINDSSSNAKLWRASIREMAFAQKLFLNLKLGWLFAKLRCLGLDQIEALFRYRRRRIAPLFNQKIQFKNPLNGEETSSSMPELLKQASEKSLEFIHAFEQWMIEPQSKLSIKGESLNFGVLNCTPNQSRYYFGKNWLES